MEKKSALEATLVQEFVVKSHADLERVKELLAQEPGLINADLGLGRRRLGNRSGRGGSHGQKRYCKLSPRTWCAPRSFCRGDAREAGNRPGGAGGVS